MKLPKDTKFDQFPMELRDDKTPWVESPGTKAESRVSMLVRHLLENGYNANDRPVLNENETINLTISANSLSLLRMDQAEETATFSAEFILEWTDAFLKWNPEQHDGQRRVKIKEAQVWRPDITVSTSISKEMLLDPNERYLDVYYDGTVRQSFYAVYTNLCNMKVDDFPYDSQICIIDIGPWSYTDEEVHCIPGESIEAPRDFFEGNSEWDFKSLLASQKHSCDTCDCHFTDSQIPLYVSRRPQFYLWVLLIPTFVITTVSIFGLFIPTNSLGDREEKLFRKVLNCSVNSGNFILAEIFVVAVGVLFSVLTAYTSPQSQHSSLETQAMDAQDSWSDRFKQVYFEEVRANEENEDGRFQSRALGKCPMVD
ncbi:Neurotransmitter-gated ion-channel ligand binding domain protein [Ostertagia ostertagi]